MNTKSQKEFYKKHNKKFKKKISKNMSCITFNFILNHCALIHQFIKTI